MTDEIAKLKAAHERLKLLYQVSNVIHSTLDPAKALQLIMQEVVRTMRASSGSVALINPNFGFLEIHAAAGLPADAARVKLRLGQGITGWVARTGKPARIGDVRSDPRYVMLHHDVRSEMAVPLEVLGETRGVLNVDSDRENAFTAEDQELLEELAVQAAKVIQNTWLYEQLRLKARLLETLVSVSQAINSTLNVNDALQVITREACSLMEGKMCSLFMLDETGEWLELRASFGAGEAYVKKPRLSAAESFLGVVIRRRKPMQLENVQTSARYQNVAIARKEGLFSLLSAPLVFSNQTIGALNVYAGEPRSFSNEEIHILTALAELSAIAIEKAQLYERIVDVEEQLRQNEKFSALGLLAAEVAHEIRNPLTVMKMLYHSLGLEFQPGDPRVKDDAILREKMDHLNKIVEQILDFARGTEPNLSEVNVNQVIDDLGLLIRHKLRNQRIQFVRRFADDLPPVMADSTQLAQAFLNLTLNAVEAMPEGGVLTISTAALRLPRGSVKPTHVTIEFKDTGQGMPLEQRRRAFSSLLSTTKQRGTGLGLAIVGRVVETHRGRVRIRSKEGKGTTLIITLPV
ncbi:MAG TPA: GAF domain-containing protein [Verrucomicrobiae bacterium]|jgi:signal transduction histidine kinase|nr:GAF domain-containing protein [Verrucomicrobiae bacterium]